MHLNISSFDKNFKELSLLLNSIKIIFNVIVLTESWLQDGVCNLIQIEGF